MAVAKRQLGRTGLEVTALSYGAMELRGAPRARDITEAQAETILNKVLDAGINYIDTSIDYGLSDGSAAISRIDAPNTIWRANAAVSSARRRRRRFELGKDHLQRVEPRRVRIGIVIERAPEQLDECVRLVTRQVEPAHGPGLRSSPPAARNFCSQVSVMCSNRSARPIRIRFVYPPPVVGTAAARRYATARLLGSRTFSGN